MSDSNVYTNIKEFCRVIDKFNGELVIRNNKVYSEGELIAVYRKALNPFSLDKKETLLSRFNKRMA